MRKFEPLFAHFEEMSRGRAVESGQAAAARAREKAARDAPAQTDTRPDDFRGNAAGDTGYL